MTDVNHSQVLVGSRHAIHNLTYPNAANRIAGTNEGKGIVPLTINNLWQIAKQDDDDSLWMCVDTAPLTWAQIPTSTAGGDMDSTYNFFGANPATITVDAAEGQTGGALTFALDGVNNLAIDLTSSNNPLGGEGGTYYGLYVNNGTDNFKVVRAGANLVDVRASLNDFIVTCSDDFNLTAPNFTQTLSTDAVSGDFINLTSSGSSGLSAASGIQNWVDMFVRIEQSGTAAYNALRINLTEASVGSGDTNLLKMITGGSTQFQVASDGNTRIGTGTPGVATGAGDLYVTGDIEAGAVSVTKAGTVKTNVDFLSLTNTANAVDMDGTSTGVLWNQWYYDGVTPAIADAGRIAVGTEQDWTSTVGTQDSYMAFETALDGTVSEKVRITSAGVLKVGGGTPTVATGAGDLFVSSDLEVDGIAEVYTLRVADDSTISGLDAANLGALRFRNGAQTPDTFTLEVGSLTNSIVMIQYADAAYDFAHGLQSTPTLFFQSDAQSATEWGSLTHDGDYFRVNTGAGSVCIGTGTPSYATGLGDLFATGDIEADSIFSTSGIKIATSQIIEHTSQNSTLPSILLANGTQSPSTGQLLTGTNANSWIICEAGDKNYNFAHALQTTPTLFFQSDAQSATEWGSITHDGDYFRLNTGAGAVAIGTGTPAYAVGVGDLFTTDAMEIGGSQYCLNSTFYLGSGSTGFSFGTGSNPTRFFMNETFDQLLLACGSDIGRQFIIGDFDYAGTDHGHATPTNPTLFGHAATDPAGAGATHWWSHTHDQTNAVWASGAGGLSLAPATGEVILPDAGKVVYDIAPASDLTATGDISSSTVDSNATGIGAALYQAADGNWDEADASALVTMPCRALAIEAGTGTKKILRRGWIRDDSWSWTPGGPVYVSTTTGALTQTKPSATGNQVQIVGYAETADILDFNPASFILEVA